MRVGPIVFWTIGRWAEELGISVAAMRNVCTNLHVPYFQIGQTRWVSYTSLLLALRAVSAVGHGNIKIDAPWQYKPRNGEVKAVDLEWLKENYELALYMLMVDFKNVKATLDPKMGRILQQAADQWEEVIRANEELAKLEAHGEVQDFTPEFDKASELAKLSFKDGESI